MRTWLSSWNRAVHTYILTLPCVVHHVTMMLLLPGVRRDICTCNSQKLPWGILAAQQMENLIGK